MTTNFKTNPLYIQLKEKLKGKYKNNFESFEDFFYIYHKSMTFFVEAYDDEQQFIIVSGLHNIELYDGDTQAFNDEFQLPDYTMETEKDVDDFIEDLDFMIKTCDADKRCTKILKAVDKLYSMAEDNSYDRDFLCQVLCMYFDI